ncbi:hypothetical protein ASPACDRAFT_42744 [Aspergillus aculeatus ATCC 16872]|uniref:Uncharacterized protein n=1 Tax=Aspergillus aculeatus (strain ATCC 16872 / CBS 172.66 / WB 5094) TaxID=690307 RepID=A0A1L9WVJ6_ASPA1|nr:uncharacterized protein ASPACDRAFT_42744 [Aspergillus aculeatus ATCC 16872]OJK00164.1 hypothetical protein ASPACDRAFT_42744 [Aspergillus aculeatus ATCC 16872]
MPPLTLLAHPGRRPHRKIFPQKPFTYTPGDPITLPWVQRLTTHLEHNDIPVALLNRALFRTLNWRDSLFMDPCIDLDIPGHQMSGAIAVLQAAGLDDTPRTVTDTLACMHHWPSGPSRHWPADRDFRLEDAWWAPAHVFFVQRGPYIPAIHHRLWSQGPEPDSPDSVEHPRHVVMVRLFAHEPYFWHMPCPTFRHNPSEDGDWECYTMVSVEPDSKDGGGEARGERELPRMVRVMKPAQYLEGMLLLHWRDRSLENDTKGTSWELTFDMLCDLARRTKPACLRTRAFRPEMRKLLQDEIQAPDGRTDREYDWLFMRRRIKRAQLMYQQMKGTPMMPQSPFPVLPSGLPESLHGTYTALMSGKELYDPDLPWVDRRRGLFRLDEDGNRIEGLYAEDDEETDSGSEEFQDPNEGGYDYAIEVYDPSEPES